MQLIPNFNFWHNSLCTSGDNPYFLDVVPSFILFSLFFNSLCTSADNPCFLSILNTNTQVTNAKKHKNTTLCVHLQIIPTFLSFLICFLLCSLFYFIFTLSHVCLFLSWRCFYFIFTLSRVCFFPLGMHGNINLFRSHCEFSSQQKTKEMRKNIEQRKWNEQQHLLWARVGVASKQ